MSVAGTHKERARADFRDRALDVVAGQGASREPCACLARENEALAASVDGRRLSTGFHRP